MVSKIINYTRLINASYIKKGREKNKNIKIFNTRETFADQTMWKHYPRRENFTRSYKKCFSEFR